MPLQPAPAAGLSCEILPGSPAFAQLPRFLRVLLMADGTVTTSLEAFFAEPIRIEAVTQTLTPTTCAVPLLNATAGTELIDRRVRLRGGDSARVYAYAESLLQPAALPPTIRHDILAGRIGIGELLRNTALPSFRELIAMSSEHNGVALFLDARYASAISRTYRIFLEGTPAILITEYFPRALYEETA